MWKAIAISCLILLLVFSSKPDRAVSVSASPRDSQIPITLEQFSSQVISDPPPATIRVRITGQAHCDTSLPYTVQTLNFYDYLRHVLPNEWLYTWDRESLRAGAVAIKMYAWYWIERGGKWPDADVYDSACDQVYNPNITHTSTDQALHDTWNWMLTQDGEILQTVYLHICRSPRCLDQVQSQRLALGGYTWDEILGYFYPGSGLSLIYPPEDGFALNFTNPHAGGVQIPLTGSEYNLGVNAGAGDFTLEWWLKANQGRLNKVNTACTSDSDWRQGAVLFDRSQSGQGGEYGIAIMDGKLAFNVAGPQGDGITLCGNQPVADGRWHHLVVQREAQSGQLWTFVDGNLDSSGIGPGGDISYIPRITEDSPTDAILAVGTLKDNSNPASTQFRGWLDEIRFSNVLRYSPTGFEPLEEFFIPDRYTTALYHLDEGLGRNILDSSGWGAQPSDGFRSDPTSTGGLEWGESSIFSDFHLFLPNVVSVK